MEIELHRIVRSWKRFWRTGLSVVVAMGALMVLIGVIVPKAYTSDSGLLVVPTNSLVGNPNTIIDLSYSERILRPILEEFGIEKAPEDFANENVNSYSVPGTSLVRIEVTYSDAQMAADITNAIAASVKTRSYELGLGVLQRDLNNFVYERDQIDIQLATTNAQISQISGQSGELSTEDQARLKQLQDQRLRLEQRRADFDISIRSAQNAVATFVDPVIVNDLATPAERSESISPVVFGAIGAVLGGLVGVAVMLWRELRDKRIRDSSHLAQLTCAESILRISGYEGMPLVAARVAGIARRLESSAVVVVAPHGSEATKSHIAGLVQDVALADLQVGSLSGILDPTESISLTPSAAVAVLLIEEQRTEESEVVTAMGILRDFGAVSITPVLLST